MSAVICHQQNAQQMLEVIKSHVYCSYIWSSLVQGMLGYNSLKETSSSAAFSFQKLIVSFQFDGTKKKTQLANWWPDGSVYSEKGRGLGENDVSSSLVCPAYPI